LFLSKILYFFNAYGFDGNIEVWLIGVVLIIIYQVFYKKDYTNLCLIDTQKLMSAEEAITKINFFLELVDKRNSKESFKIILKGYIFQHEEICEIKDCPLKVYKKKLLENCETLKEEEYKLLLAYCKILYDVSISMYAILKSI